MNGIVTNFRNGCHEFYSLMTHYPKIYPEYQMKINPWKCFAAGRAVFLAGQVLDMLNTPKLPPVKPVYLSYGLILGALEIVSCVALIFLAWRLNRSFPDVKPAAHLLAVAAFSAFFNLFELYMWNGFTSIPEKDILGQASFMSCMGLLKIEMVAIANSDRKNSERMVTRTEWHGNEVLLDEVI